jgi:rfaE bifunctional protein nucleotidyltransferase chain/domain
MNPKQQLYSKVFEGSDSFQKKLHLWRFKGYKVVFTNGCFDLVHPGHIDTLTTAKSFGDKLIVGLNSDSSVSGLKGPKRPIMDQNARALLLSSFSFVDAVILFNEPTPEELIKSITPDILVKGGDYTIDTIVGAEWVLQHGGKVETVPLVEGWSTTGIETKISTIEGDH